MEITDPASYGIKRKRTTQLITSTVERLKSYGIYFQKDIFYVLYAAIQTMSMFI